MKIGIQTWGSLGDIRPFLALANGLHRDGHEVTLAITRVDHPIDDIVALPGVKLVSVASPVVHEERQLKLIEQSVFGQADPMKQTQAIIEQMVLPAESAMFDAAIQLCHDNDLVIGHFFHYPLRVAAELTQCPFASMTLVHSIIPSAHVPPVGLPNLGAWGNRISWKLARSLLNRKVKPYSDRLRLAHNMDRSADLLTDVWNSRQLTLIAVSQQICNARPDWPPNFYACGFMNPAPSSADAAIPEPLEAFLSSGEAPVYMTFGSLMAGNKQKQSLSLLREAATLAGVRAVIQAPNWQDYGLGSDNTFFYVSEGNHARLFPRCSAIIHHGGAGTTQSALLAGKPSVVVAHISEQAFWGSELARLRAAAKPLNRQNLTPRKLAERIRHTIDSKDFSTRAMLIAENMHQEDGVSTAVKLIRQHFETRN